MALREWGGRHHHPHAGGGRRHDRRCRDRAERWPGGRRRLARRRALGARGAPLRRCVVGLMADLVQSRVEQVTAPLCYHAEGPVWSPSWGGLRWVDMLAGDLLTLHADGSVASLHVGEVAAFVRPRTR